MTESVTGTESTPPAPPLAAPSAESAAPRTRLAPLYLALLFIAVAAGGATGYLYQRQQAQTAATLRAMSALEQQLMQERSASETLKLALAEERGQRQQALSQLNATLAHQAEAVAELRQPQQQRWQLSEVAYLARLATRRLWYEYDVASAIALLEDADHLLTGVEGAQALDARAALAKDLATLRSLPAPDLDGLRLTLGGLLDQVRLLPLPHETVPRSEEVEASDNWRSNLVRSWKQLADTFFVVHHDNGEALPLVMPEQAFWLRQNLRLTLQRADVALRLRDDAAYQAALAEASQWLNHYFDTQDARVLSVAQSLDRLTTAHLKPDLPPTLAVEAVVGNAPAMAQRPAEPEDEQ